MEAEAFRSEDPEPYDRRVLAKPQTLTPHRGLKKGTPLGKLIGFLWDIPILVTFCLGAALGLRKTPKPKTCKGCCPPSFPRWQEFDLTLVEPKDRLWLVVVVVVGAAAAAVVVDAS